MKISIAALAFISLSAAVSAQESYSSEPTIESQTAESLSLDDSTTLAEAETKTAMNLQEQTAEEPVMQQPIVEEPIAEVSAVEETAVEDNDADDADDDEEEEEDIVVVDQEEQTPVDIVTEAEAEETPIVDEAFLQKKVLNEEAIPENIIKVEQEAQQRVNFTIDWVFVDTPGNGLDNYYEFSASETGLMNYTFTNYENEDTLIYAVSGQIIEPEKYEIVANITETEIGPIYVGVNETVSFLQKLELVLPEGVFFVTPMIHFGEAEDPKRVGAAPKAIRILPAPLSFFNPEFLTILLTLGVISYYSYKSVYSYDKKPNKKALKAQARDAKIDASTWVPDNHKK